MTWELEIHHIDVGQGDCTLIIAQDTADSDSTRTVLIDGGRKGGKEGNLSEKLNKYIQTTLQDKRCPIKIDTIITTHYDDDHYGGIIELINSDNIYRLYELVAQTVTSVVKDYIRINKDVNTQTAAGIGASVARIIGFADYDVNNTNSNVGTIAEAAVSAYHNPFNGSNQDAYHKETFDAALNKAKALIGEGKNPEDPNPLLQTGPNYKFKDIAKKVSIYAGVESPLRSALVYPDCDKSMIAALFSQRFIPDCFNTLGIYKSTKIIDLGNSGVPNQVYPESITGQFYKKSEKLGKVPMIPPREREVATLGDEILGINDMQAPKIYTVAGGQEVFGGPSDVNIKMVGADNENSIASIIKFNDFSYYTGGDLPTMESANRTAKTVQGENGVAKLLFQKNSELNALINPARRISAGRLGHHGSAESSSKYFLGKMKFKAVFISAGFNSYGHPSEDVISRLKQGEVNKNLEKVYLTNAYDKLDDIPATQGWKTRQDSRENKFMVSGQINNEMHASDNGAGNVILKVTEAQSIETSGSHEFSVEYLEYDFKDAGEIKTVTHKCSQAK